MGSATTPIAPGISRYQASPRPFTFLSVICINGLKCASSNVRPFNSQFEPAPDSAATRASVTSPAFTAVCAGALHPAPIPNPSHAPATPSTCNIFITSPFALSPPEPAAFPKRDVRRVFAVMVGSALTESQRNELNRLFAVKNGGRDRARTGDPLLAKQVVSQLSYTPTAGVTFILKHLRRFQNPFLRFLRHHCTKTVPKPPSTETDCAW